MSLLNKIYNFFTKNSKVIKIVTTCVLSVAFISSIAGAVLIGGELFEKEELPTEEPRGMISLNEASYRTTYINGDNFVFNKEDSKVGLYVKDPEVEDIIMVEDLPSNEYGFLINGSGDIVLDANRIVISPEIKTIDIVSVNYPMITHTLDINVLGDIDTSKLSARLILEAETDADVYRGGNLLTREQLASQPDKDKPFISNEGETIAGTDCSGGACLRNFQSNDMRIEYKIISYEEINVKLTVMVCKRNKQGVFNNWFIPKINGEEITDVSNQVIPAGSGYFTPYSLEEVIVPLNRGINVITFESGPSAGTSNPANFDGIKIQAPQPVIGDMSVIVNSEVEQ